MTGDFQRIFQKKPKTENKEKSDKYNKNLPVEVIKQSYYKSQPSQAQPKNGNMIEKFKIVFGKSVHILTIKLKALVGKFVFVSI